ncbi:hypothetical protein BU24DRAFT_287268 [Aaosphaeria arxii CBS 175.79]|uniref:Secreted protein n=1 Tax=Aaosphaeria arxii CBS 175.79 TaxID=1450172 RepID=A0A6A5XFS2_9PLEO|nr:uncharacterized protein BU24DRAFT_287268 [Aaosphaeria arxii CBS 175.79]KAF2011696.1 hypothetical protein BU24DRAFT_287268 [Aaosphaeria arxii CBS 175.79]
MLHPSLTTYGMLFGYAAILLFRIHPSHSSPACCKISSIGYPDRDENIPPKKGKRKIEKKKGNTMKMIRDGSSMLYTACESGGGR